MKYITPTDAVDGGLMLFGLTVSLQDIQSVLSIIIIVIDILWLVGKFIIKFFRYIKDGKLDDDELADLTNDIDNIKRIKEGDNNE